ncbi:glycosyl transferase [Siccirubricoccus deserti]|uniref:WecB/TagA/CpsF family glycosyltransferase n=1 Tax=Siccirubricoccus deserti TaxID=2013562 RepID=UPI0019C963E5|nr:WecB/TagA/CpsF family glycosyltransferase [Siccirubricoccus deserti]GGC43220.1 glycosyl transferase [Siccirubricoccus deserti]
MPFDALTLGNPQDGAPTLRLLGLDFADLTLPAVVARLAARPADAPFSYVVTPNADHLVRLARRPALRPLYHEAGLRLLDSRVVARLARLMGLPAPQVVPGSDLVAALVGQAIAPEEPVTILGMPAEAVEVLRRRTGLNRIAHHDPPMGFEHDPAALVAALDFIEAHPARFTFLAVGSPRQCMVANALARRGVARGTGLCIGASLLFLCGLEKRAPQPVQRAGLEWAWRLAADPRRLARRYLVDSPAIVTLLRQEARLRRN